MAQRPKRTNAIRRLGWSMLRIVVLLIAIAVVLRLGGCMERLFYQPMRASTPLPPEMPGAESVDFASADGTKLHGWFIPARNRAPDAGPAPTIIHVHGNAGNIEHHLYFSEFLPGSGFNLFIFDYRGYGQSEGRPRRREQLIADTHAAVDAVLARDDVDPGRIGVFGHSLGGGIALHVMAERDEIRAAVIMSSFASFRDIAANVVGGREPGAIARALAALLIDDRLRPLDAIARIERPILVIHGEADRTIPVSHGRRLADAAPDAELLLLAGGDHNDLRSTHPEADRAMIAFYRTHLEQPNAVEEPMEEESRP
jgi:fermentation-respiration switch protein FrsA (DUF1100 family)